VASESSTRLWRVYREANRPWPVICPEDDVIDYMVMEAVCIKATNEDAEARKKAEEEQEKQQWKSDLSELEQHRTPVQE
jgi:hypothetical protein